ncbi:hypothetical protein ES754_05695 [Psychrobacter frigidicola]|uniref:Spore coat protein U domain-containing protein n=1 Tax=Psychrobacter frigidicola TaxID=45611 RepID=A0A5C7A6X1_9GAMM|nr:hypothetical protein [Psychrobacter frigidicola]TXD98410.1 hypothetical protein ES754_05695 [Psychrobacter frigidicola]
MKTLIKLAGSTALLVGMIGTGMTTASAASQSGDMHYTADCGVKELRMAKGSYDVSRAGAIKGSNYCEYQIYAKKGQSISATIVGNDDLYPILYGANSPDLSNQTVTLDKTGEHTIRVLQPRNQAREGNTPKPYYMTVTVK